MVLATQSHMATALSSGVSGFRPNRERKRVRAFSAYPFILTPVGVVPWARLPRSSGV